MSKIILLTYCRNAYDHELDIEYDTYYGSFVNDTARRTVYINRAEAYMARNDTGWYSMIEVDTLSGETHVWFLRKNELKKRVELNIPAKEAQAMRKLRRPSTVNEILDSLENAPPTFNTAAWPTPMPFNINQEEPEEEL